LGQVNTQIILIMFYDIVNVNTIILRIVVQLP
jgi:hypothetical protein